MQVAVIEHEVKKLLGTENVTLVEIAGYLTIARRILDGLRGEGRPRFRSEAGFGYQLRQAEPAEPRAASANAGTRDRVSPALS